MTSVKLPTSAELAAVGKQLGMALSDADIAFFLETMPGNVAAYGALEAMADNVPPVKYPRTPGYRPEGEADMAMAGDQGGSIRMPAAYCGIVGLKPTWGLVPYSGIMPIELTLDHTGPMTGNVKDNALMLEVLAGPDGLDPRQLGCTVDT